MGYREKHGLASTGGISPFQGLRPYDPRPPVNNTGVELRSIGCASKLFIKNTGWSITAASACYFISCSNESNSAVEKNSPSVISNPSHSFLIVTVPGFWLSPFRMLLIVAWETAEIVQSLLGVIPRSLHNCLIRCAITSLVPTTLPPVDLSLIW